MRMTAFLIVLLVMLCASGFAFAQGDKPAAAPAGAEAAPAGHALVWLELDSTDTQATAKFLTDTFGWEMQPFEAMPGYIFYMTPQGLSGGISPLEKADKAGATPYIYVPDIAQTLKDIAAAGGKTVLEPIEIPGSDGGFIALFSDPSGTVYGLSNMSMTSDYHPLPFKQDGAANEKPVDATLCSIELYGKDLAETAKFFGSLFQWASDTAMGPYMGFTPGAGVSGVFQSHTGALPVMPYIWADDPSAAMERAVAAGATVTMPVQAVAEMGVSFGYFVAPGGINMGLMGPVPGK